LKVDFPCRGGYAEYSCGALLSLLPERPPLGVFGAAQNLRNPNSGETLNP